MGGAIQGWCWVHVLSHTSALHATCWISMDMEWGVVLKSFTHSFKTTNWWHVCQPLHVFKGWVSDKNLEQSLCRGSVLIWILLIPNHWSLVITHQSFPSLHGIPLAGVILEKREMYITVLEYFWESVCVWVCVWVGTNRFVNFHQNEYFRSLCQN